MLIQSTRRPQSQNATPAVPSNAPVQENPDQSETPAVDDRLLAGDAGDRIAHFMRGVTQESLQHLRYLSAASAFQKVGSTVGSLALTPLAIKLANENAALVGGLAIGGTVAAGVVGAALGYAWLYRRDGQEDENKPKEFSKVSDSALAAGSVLQALPKFVYPSVVGATDAQIDTIYNALDKLPLHQATASATMQVVPDLVDTGISGMAQPGNSHVHILLDESYINSAHRGEHLVLHEQAHAVDYSGGFGLLGAHNWKAGFGQAPFVSGYAESNRYEDFAESFEAYHVDPESFRRNFPEKAAAIEKISHADPLSAAADNSGVRTAGRNIGRTIGKVPYLRTGLELAGSLVAPIQTYRGASKLIEGLESGDKAQAVDGKLNLATGLFLTLPGATPLALGSGVAGSAIRMSLKDNEEHLEEADKWANRVLSVSAGPVGMAVGAIVGEMEANGLKMDESKGFSAEGWQSSRPGKGAMLKGTLATVGGVVGGAVAGASLGAALSGPPGAFLGALWGQMAGGMIGLGGYAVHRTLSQSKKDGDPLALTAGDKKFLKGTLGGAVAGAGVGTLAGALGGRALGQWVGNAVGGPAAASTLGSVGGWLGGLSLAYGGAKLGASAGSGRLFGQPPIDPDKSK